jgi:membrane-associated protease RseP (regulator of RpoE activity)
MSILAAIAVLAILIVVHELGHFAAARLQGIHVNRFSIGFGPVLFKYQGAETEYALRAFPLGGFVGFPDDDPDCAIPPDDPNLLRNRPLLDRAIVISAGVIANLIFAYFVLVGQGTTVGIYEPTQPGVLVPQVVENLPADQAGIKAGDIILAVNDRELGVSVEVRDLFQEMIQKSPNQPVNLTVQRDQENINLTVTPQADAEGKGKIGVSLDFNGKFIRHRLGMTEAVDFANTEFQRLTRLTAQGFWQLISNFKETAQQVSGPVKIVEYGATIAKNDAGSLFEFGALISINLAIINILPLPALDGGQLVFLMIEGLLGRPLPLKLQEGIMQTGLVLLLGLGMFLIVRDTLNLAVFQDLISR